MRTSFHHQPEAQHPKFSAIHKLPADYPIFGPVADIAKRAVATSTESGGWFPVPKTHRHRNYCLARTSVRIRTDSRVVQVTEKTQDVPIASKVLPQVCDGRLH